MKKCSKLSVCIAVLAMLSSAVHSYTLTFDDVPSGTALWPSYFDTYGLTFSQSFQVSDHSAYSWGTPHSGTNVAVVTDSALSLGRAGVTFGYIDADGTGRLDDIRSVGAYFGTQAGVMITIKAYHLVVVPFTLTLIDTVVIGAPGESWDNRYVEIGSSSHPFNELQFEGVNSRTELLGFGLDDMTITPVPEPGGMLCLVVGVIGVLVRRRR